ncbi:hypothetical protein DIPPA_18932 [Diplonema papillatum]|nr:hypothetical protein DIPPA_18932 [Diplonema papillatum]
MSSALVVLCSYGEAYEGGGGPAECLDVVTSFLRRQDVRGPIHVLADDGRSDFPSKHRILEGLRSLIANAVDGDELVLVLIGCAGDVPNSFVPLDYSTAGLITPLEVRSLLVDTLPQSVSLSMIVDLVNGGSALELPRKLTAEQDPATGQMLLRLDASSLPPLPCGPINCISTVKNATNGRNFGVLTNALVTALHTSPRSMNQQLLADVWHIMSQSSSGPTGPMPRLSGTRPFSASDSFLLVNSAQPSNQPAPLPALPAPPPSQPYGLSHNTPPMPAHRASATPQAHAPQAYTHAPQAHAHAPLALEALQGTWYTSSMTEVRIVGSEAHFVATGHVYDFMDTPHGVLLMGSKLLGAPLPGAVRLVWDDGDVWAKQGASIPVLHGDDNPSGLPADWGRRDGREPLPSSLLPPMWSDGSLDPINQLSARPKYSPALPAVLNLLIGRARRDITKRAYDKWVFFLLLARQFRRINNIGLALEKSGIGLLFARYLHKWRLWLVLRRPTLLPYKFRPVKARRMAEPPRIAIWLGKAVAARRGGAPAESLYEALRSVTSPEDWETVKQEYSAKHDAANVEEELKDLLKPMELGQCSAILLCNGIVFPSVEGMLPRTPAESQIGSRTNPSSSRRSSVVSQQTPFPGPSQKATRPPTAASSRPQSRPQSPARSARPPPSQPASSRPQSPMTQQPPTSQPSQQPRNSRAPSMVSQPQVPTQPNSRPMSPLQLNSQPPSMVSRVSANSKAPSALNSRPPSVINARPPSVAVSKPPSVANSKPPSVANSKPPSVANSKPPSVANSKPPSQVGE